jgi:hypothetical protein
MSGTFDELSEEALRLVRCNHTTGKKKISIKRKEIQIEVGNLKEKIDEALSARLLASQQ